MAWMDYSYDQCMQQATEALLLAHPPAISEQPPDPAVVMLAQAHAFKAQAWIAFAAERREAERAGLDRLVSRFDS
jgi:hypothetical protein